MKNYCGYFLVNSGRNGLLFVPTSCHTVPNIHAYLYLVTLFPSYIHAYMWSHCSLHTYIHTHLMNDKILNFKQFADSFFRDIEAVQFWPICHSNLKMSNLDRRQWNLKDQTCFVRTQRIKDADSGCGVVGGAVASNAKDPRFESSHRQFYLLWTVLNRRK